MDIPTIVTPVEHREEGPPMSAEELLTTLTNQIDNYPYRWIDWKTYTPHLDNAHSLQWDPQSFMVITEFMDLDLAESILGDIYVAFVAFAPLKVQLRIAYDGADEILPNLIEEDEEDSADGSEDGK